MDVGHRQLRRLPAFAVLTVGALVLGTGAGTAAPVAAPEAQAQFIAATTSVTAERWAGEEGVYLDLGTHLVAGKDPLEFRVKRSAYSKPIDAFQLVRGAGGKQRAVLLPAGMVKDFTGLADFTHLKLIDSAGRTVVERDENFCPNDWGSTRTRVDAPDSTPYPTECAWNPFVLGGVWGIQAGWSAATSNWWSGPVNVADGSYTAEVSINPQYRKLLNIPDSAATLTLSVTVQSDDEGGRRAAEQLPSDSKQRVLGAPGDDEHVAHGEAVSDSAPGLKPGARPAVRAKAAPQGPRPDLRSLPAWQIGVEQDEETGHDQVTFNATVWNGGTSPLVVDGFRRTGSGSDLMDAYQYFYDANGTQVGYAQAGTMEWDARPGHDHWHFTDFAQYRLLNADKTIAVRSGKEAFCLANTDAVDLTLPYAKWRPTNTDLGTSCGRQTSVAVRQVLDIGSGDTYAQYLPGQSFDITDLPNGTYYIEVAANPDQRLQESNLNNNNSYRKIILGGTPGARTVTVPPHEGIEG
ncbi:lysyl oxidase family protein [Micromonospora endophytica]|uniref:Uncharacterized protein n=1 Tax=Micromonospora endophytica TaxID=515350 RepID=A0A2W2CYH8_9ACTN|nr:lysyl oxidase family protein [Micromonospora endophytica]PZF90096.1 hypothetical protein C1I93_23135 [Micromonospora endophytica]RIW42475.1 hypothetical protein D3H59_23250 [Micromonospora endophytica]BCJ57658.1 hypothetical protein Jiend_10800 [Micromonospora endophytica]